MKLLKGDCLELLPTIPDGSVDLILCDPPYGSTKQSWDLSLNPEAMFEECWRVLKPDGALVLFGASTFTAELILTDVKNYRYSWVWAKDSGVGFLNAKRRPMKRHEDIIVFYRKQPTYNPQGLKPFNKTIKTRKKFTEESALGKIGVKNLGGEFIQEFTNYPTSILEFKNEKGFHPTQKPITLLEYLIKTYTNPGETVLDFCMGSGSTGVAAKNTGRQFVGVEKDEKYFNIAKDRIGTDDEGSREENKE